MSLQLQLDATLSSGPSEQTDNLFPSSTNTIPFGLVGGTKAYNVESSGVVIVNTPAPGFQTVPGIGASGIVTQGHTLYVRATSAMLLQMTMANPNGGPAITITIPIQGVQLYEFPASNGYLTALGVQGSGTFEYAVYGNQ